MGNAGRRGGRWQRLRTNLKAQRHPCWLCGQPINYTLTWPDPASFSVDHVTPLSQAPHLAEDPTNLRAAHLSCNSARQNNQPTPALGDTDGTW